MKDDVKHDVAMKHHVVVKHDVAHLLVCLVISTKSPHLTDTVSHYAACPVVSRFRVMHVYMHIYVYTHIYIHIYICIYVYVYVYIYIYVYTYIYIYIYT